MNKSKKCEKKVRKGKTRERNSYGSGGGEWVQEQGFQEEGSSGKGGPGQGFQAQRSGLNNKIGRKTFASA